MLAMAELTYEPVRPPPPEERPSIPWDGTVAELFAQLTAPGRPQEEAGMEYLVRAVRLRVSVRRSTDHYPRLELHVSRKPGPLTADAVRWWQRDNARLLADARSTFGIGWTVIEEDDAGEGIRRVYLELLPGEVVPGEQPCACGAKAVCDDLPGRCLAQLHGAMRQTSLEFKEPQRPIVAPYGGKA